MRVSEEYDYVVVGGGSGGSVVGSRLAAAGFEVLVLEAGGTDRLPDTRIPAGTISAYRRANWSYQPDADPTRGNAVEPWAAGKILGGGGSINATVFVRGHRADYDGWEASGCPGWGFDDVLSRLKRMESWSGGANEYRGGGGPIATGFQSTQHPSIDAFLDAAQGSGHVFTEDYNGAVQKGVGHTQVNQRRGFRSQASFEYRRRLDVGENLSIKLKAHATRLIVEGGAVTGVEYQSGKKTAIVRARNEVILSAGALGTPKLLMLSGLGPSEELKRFNIPVALVAEGVGRNLQEHPAALQRWHSKVPTVNKIRPADVARGVRDYIKDGSGLLASTVFQIQVMHQTDDALPFPDAQIAFANFALTRERAKNGMMKVQPHPDEGVLISTLFLHPRGRGRVGLRSADPLAPPLIDHAMFQDRRDLEGLLNGMAEGRRIMERREMKPVTGGMFEPESANKSDKDWEEWARVNATYGVHPCGTVRMGTDDEAPVDPQLRFKGIDGLRVVDASVMPFVTTGNTNCPTMLVGEMAADFILGT